MKSFIKAIAVAAVLAIPAVSFAQSAPVTRTEVRAQLAQLERAGYNPASDQTEYPRNIQAAEARVAAQSGTSAGYGGVSDGTSAAGSISRPVANDGTKPLYFGH
jgi:hypothetical protein